MTSFLRFRVADHLDNAVQRKWFLSAIASCHLVGHGEIMTLFEGARSKTRAYLDTIRQVKAELGIKYEVGVEHLASQRNARSKR